jgi:hypothetical protein
MDHFSQVDEHTGEYNIGDSSILISAELSSVLQDRDWNDGDVPSLLGFGQQASRSGNEEAAANMAAKHLVLYINQIECLYFAHALANVLPGVAVVLQGARDAGYKVSAVVPDSGRSFFSSNTEKMLNMMGVDLLRESPSTPHQTAIVSAVKPFSPHVKQLMQRELRRGFFGDLPAKDCSTRPASAGVFLSRKAGANNGRWLEGSEILEEELQKKGFEIKDNLGEIPIEDVAKDLYQNHCTMTGFAGGNLLNLVFMPDKAKLVEYNPDRIYADRMIFVKAFGYDFVHNVPSGAITAENVEELVNIAL